MKPSLLGITQQDLRQQLSEHGYPAYRVDQILDWVWKKRPASIEQMSNLPKALRDFLQENYSLYPLTPARELGSIDRSEAHTSELQSHHELVCRLLLEKKNKHP